MTTSVKLDSQPVWFEFAHVESRQKAKSLGTDIKKSKSVRLGRKLKAPEPNPILPSKMGLTELFAYRNSSIAKQILISNTFFHGKVGYFQHVMRKIYELAEIYIEDITFLHTAQNLPKEKKPEQLILLPNVKSEEDLNDFVARSLRHKSEAPTWLVANPSTIYKHLLLGFNNFFIASNNSEEIEYLQNVLSFPKTTIDFLLEGETIFITDFELVVNKAYEPIAIIRIVSFD